MAETTETTKPEPKITRVTGDEARQVLSTLPFRTKLRDGDAVVLRDGIPSHIERASAPQV